jgi:hypothetical protein
VLVADAAKLQQLLTDGDRAAALEAEDETEEEEEEQNPAADAPEADASGAAVLTKSPATKKAPGDKRDGEPKGAR